VEGEKEKREVEIIRRKIMVVTKQGKENEGKRNLNGEGSIIVRNDV
jgi:hypothetical protein